MKYNANMKNFKTDVLKNLYAMCGRDDKIPALARDGSSAPLREHLKEYGKTLKVDNGDDIMYDFLPSRGIKIQLSRPINTDGDSRLELSVSQMATFIRGCVQDGSWKEPDDGENSEQESPENPTPEITERTYFDALQEKFPEIKDCTDEEIADGMHCVRKYFSAKVPCADEDCVDCWRRKCEGDFSDKGYELAQEDINDFMKNHNVHTDGEAVPSETDTQNQGMSGQAPGAEIIPIEVAKIKPHPNNPRADVGDISELTESIRANGIMQNLTVVPDEEPGYFRCLIGHRRLSAAREIGLKTVPCAVSRNMPLADQVAIMLAENMQRADLTPPEQADGIQMMLDLGDTLEKVVEKTGLSESTVRKRVKLAQFENKDAVRQSFERGATIADFDKLEKIKDPKTREKLVQDIGTNNFDWNLKNAIRDEERKADGEKIAKFLDTFAEKIDKPDNAEMKYIGSYSDPDKMEKPRDYDPEKKYYYALSYSYAQLYALKSDAEKAEYSKADEDKKIAEEQRRERIAGLKEIKSRMEKSRDDFILNFKNFPGGKTLQAVRYDKVIELIFEAYMQARTSVVDGKFYRFMGIELKNYNYAEAGKTLIDKTARQGISGAQMLTLMGYSMLNVTWDTWEYDGEYSEDTGRRYAELYEFLEACGYEISDEERAFIDGTHELYTKGD